ncbi:von Willebrand factor A domain-containing protein 5A [Orchesella cincta]|uniref:von Willebrand factor A domain-containing protein 5A n=1 Tax=Orchesella cincta TaxID=48709 RepID=A0A1D2M4X1_ORCCI|nr:von Willebrand factor A domain-containing protein 5A [Orchesella cincta]
MPRSGAFTQVGSELVSLRNTALYPTSKLDDQKFEFIFMLDISGSMYDEPIQLAKEALLLFLQSMPADCYFNVITFQSYFKCFFPNSVKYSQETLEYAKQRVNALKAGGLTELYKPLSHVYSQPRISGYLTQIFTITDGRVDDRDTVLELVKANVQHSRSFSLGIGDEVDRELVIGIAENAGGTYEFVTYGEKIESKILNQLKVSLQPGLLRPIRVNTESILIPMYKNIEVN